MSATPERPKKPSFNPVELLIFSVVGGIVLQSVYSLVTGMDNYQAVALTPTLPKRALASLPKSPLATLELSCEKESTQETDANKARLEGSICSGVKTTVTHSTDRKPATVFQDPREKRFSTDYIPLIQGTNAIQVRFTDADGSSVTHDVTVIRQPRASSSRP